MKDKKEAIKEAIKNKATPKMLVELGLAVSMAQARRILHTPKK